MQYDILHSFSFKNVLDIFLDCISNPIVGSSKIIFPTVKEDNDKLIFIFVQERGSDSLVKLIFYIQQIA